MQKGKGGAHAHAYFSSPLSPLPGTAQPGWTQVTDRTPPPLSLPCQALRSRGGPKSLAAVIEAAKPSAEESALVQVGGPCGRYMQCRQYTTLVRVGGPCGRYMQCRQYTTLVQV